MIGEPERTRPRMLARIVIAVLGRIFFPAKSFADIAAVAI
jgi:hypothetical protein